MPDSTEADSPRDSKNTGSRAKRGSRLRKVLAAAVAVVTCLLLYNGTASLLVTRWDNTAERDSDTGILLGAEALDLGPRDAEAAVVLVHGFVGASNNFWELPRRLADSGYRVRAMRLPGHGLSPRDFAKTPGDEILAAVQAEVRLLRDQHARVFLVGHSMGGALGTLVASTENVDGLILGAPYYGITYHWYYVLPPELWITLTGPFVPWVYKGNAFICVKRPEAKAEILSYRWIPAKGSRTLVELGRRANAQDTLAKVSCPVLVLHGRDDQAASPRASQKAFEALGSQSKKLVWLENSDHHIFWDYDRERVVEEILQFLDSIPTEGKA